MKMMRPMKPNNSSRRYQAPSYIDVFILYICLWNIPKTSASIY